MDQRMRLMNEILSGIKVLKLFGWERSFEEKVKEVRRKELLQLEHISYVNAATGFLFFSVPFLVSLVSFLTFVLMDAKNILDPTKVFVSLALFNTLRFPLGKMEVHKYTIKHC